jgi:hypothetical protein
VPIQLTPNAIGEALQTGDRAMEPHREARRQVFAELVGSHYPGNKSGSTNPVNLIAHAVTTLIPHLATRSPSYEVRGKAPGLAAEAIALSMALEDLAEQLDLVRISQMVLLDALTGPCGLVRIGLRAGAELVTVNDRQLDPGMPYLCRVDLDDYVIDPAARSWEEARWEAYRYRVPKALAREQGLFDPDLIDRIQPLSEGDRQQDQLDDLGHQAAGYADRYALIETIELWDVILYDDAQTQIVTMPCEAPESFGQFLAARPWEGPQRGPLERLEFLPLSQQALGLSYTALMRDMHDAIKGAANKLVDQTQRAKQLLGYARVADKTAIRVADSPDGDSIAMDSPSDAQVFEFGGPQQSIRDMFPILWSWGNIAASLPDMLSGGASGSETATEYQGRMAQASARIQHLQSICDRFQGRIASHLGWYLTTDPFIETGGTHRLPGGETIQLKYSAETRRGTWPDFAFSIRPRSMQVMDPAVKARRINEALGLLMQGFQVASSAAMMGAPIGFDLMQMARVFSEWYDLPELADIVQDPAQQIAVQQFINARRGQMQPPQPVSPGQPGQPASPMGGPEATSPTGAARDAREFSNGQDVAR